MAAPLFFANGSVFTDAVKKSVTSAEHSAGGPVRHVVLDMEAVTDIDVTGAEAFESLQGWLEQHDVSLSFSRMRPKTKDRLVELGLLGGRTAYPTNRDAVAALTES
ncbi:sodium-independent anion transporter [Microbacterium sp. KUDC0406]|nr:sodium-independent anion transporter [Microbacterium sp. KUDC0406]